MPEIFDGKWEVRVTEKNAGFDHRFVIAGASSGNGVYPGVPGQTAIASGNNWTITLEWNNNAGSGWQPSAVLRSDGSVSPLVLVAFLRADDNFPGQRDNDFDDLVVRLTDLDPIFDVVQRPFAIDRGTLTMLPDGIFEGSQGVQYMGVRVRNEWEFDWQPWMGVRIGIANKPELAALGIVVMDAWSAAEQQALQQEVAGGFAVVPELARGAERLVYFKVNCAGAAPGKPVVEFVAQRSAWDPAYNQPSRRVRRQIFLSRSTYNPATRELVAQLPEGTVFMRLNKVVLERTSMQAAILDALRNPCPRDPPRPGRPGRRPTTRGCAPSDEERRDALRELLEALLAGKPVDPCQLRDLLESCCDGDGDCGDDGGHTDPGDGGLGDGPGSDDWCRFRPAHWLPVDFEYRIVPNPAYPGQFGPLAFEDPWWKVILIILAILLAIASLIVDYIFAGQDPNFVIGNITAKSNRTTSNVDAAIARLNSSRGRDMNVLDAQGDDRNNGLPIDGGTGGMATIDRSDNGDRGIADAVIGNVVFKSGARSGTTRGTVNLVNLAVPVDGINYTNQVFILPLAAPDNQPLSQAGDSGSLWVDLTSRRPVALNFAGPTVDDGSEAIANPIRSVATLFDIHFNT